MQTLDGVHQLEMVHTMTTAEGVTGTARRQHDRPFKAELVRRCLVPGASVAAVALGGGINANLLFKWRRDHLRATRSSYAPSASSVLVPVHRAPGGGGGDGLQSLMVPSTSIPTAVSAQRVARSTGVIELDIAGAQLRLRGPVDEASLRSVLRALRQSA